jgi:hypothetical protein
MNPRTKDLREREHGDGSDDHDDHDDDIDEELGR